MSDALLCNALRFLIVDAIRNASSGHPGMPLGFADVAFCLFKNHLVFNPKDPTWVNRDRLILSCGHGSMLLYAAFYLLGYDYSIDDIRDFRKFGSKTAGHPEYNPLLGIEATTGALGQGVGVGVGVAIAEAKLRNMFQDEVGYKTYIIASDGDLMEGISHEACSIAGNLCLKNLIILYDSNGITIDGDLSKSYSDDTAKRYESYGFFVQHVDGHDFKAINESIEKAKNSDKPSLVIFNTVIGRGSILEGKAKIHGTSLSHEDISKMRESFNWHYRPFDIPDEILQAWRGFHIRNIKRYNTSMEKFSKFLNQEYAMSQSILKAKERLNNKTMSTRAAFGVVVDNLSGIDGRLLCGSADLASSTLAKANWMHDFSSIDKSGSYINYGVREHAMGAISNGIAVGGIFNVYCSTFLVFSDYMKPAIRSAALMDIHSVFCFTHDSVGVGEDGPTHQPIEHIALLRSIPNLIVMRPADGIETAESVEVALFGLTGPSAIIMTRQEVNPVATKRERNMVSNGAYILKSAEKRDITLIASGSEVDLAINVSEILSQNGIFAFVVSMPCLELFNAQQEPYKMEVLGNVFRVFIEAGSSYGLGSFIKEIDLLFSIDSFGKSGSSKDVFEYFDFTASKIASSIMNSIARNDE